MSELHPELQQAWDEAKAGNEPVRNWFDEKRQQFSDTVKKAAAPMAMVAGLPPDIGGTVFDALVPPTMFKSGTVDEKMGDALGMLPGPGFAGYTAKTAIRDLSHGILQETGRLAPEAAAHLKDIVNQAAGVFDPEFTKAIKKFIPAPPPETGWFFQYTPELHGLYKADQLVPGSQSRTLKDMNILYPAKSLKYELETGSQVPKFPFGHETGHKAPYDLGAQSRDPSQYKSLFGWGDDVNTWYHIAPDSPALHQRMYKDVQDIQEVARQQGIALPNYFTTGRKDYWKLGANENAPPLAELVADFYGLTAAGMNPHTIFSNTILNREPLFKHLRLDTINKFANK